MDWIISTLSQIIVQRTCIYTVQIQYSGFRFKLLVFEERPAFSKIKTQDHLKTVSSFHAVSWIILRMESIPPDFFSSPTGIDRSRGRDIWHILHFAPTKSNNFSFQPNGKMPLDKKFAYWPSGGVYRKKQFWRENLKVLALKYFRQIWKNKYYCVAC